MEFISLPVVFSVLLVFVSVILILRRKKTTPVVGSDYIYITGKDDFSNFLNLLKQEKVDSIGVDIEYFRGNKYQGEVCLIQITFPSKITFLIDTILLPKEFLKRELKVVFEDPKIEKVMHACDNDIEWIYEDFSIQTENVFDTQEAERLIDNYRRREGLDDILRKYNLANIDKNYKKQLQLSNWKERPLKQDQLSYAAQDSFYLLDLSVRQKGKLGKNFDSYKEKLNKRILAKYSSSHSDNMEMKAQKFFVSNVVKLNPAIYELSKSVFTSLFRFVDSQAKLRDVNPEKIIKTKTLFKISLQLPESLQEISDIAKNVEDVSSCSDETLLTEFLQIILKEKSSMPNNIDFQEIKRVNQNHATNKGKVKDLTRTIESFSVKGLAYENCRMLAPDGEMLCYCDNKKMNWYIQRNLAKKIEDNPPTFQLFFEPHGRASKDEVPQTEFFRKNCCVVCEAESNYMRFHVVPSLYRQFFPDDLKSHRSHDVVLLCFFCMEKVNKFYEIKKRELSERYKVPLTVQTESQLELKNLTKAIMCSKSIVKNWQGIPFEKKNSILKEVLEFLENRENWEKFGKFFEEIFPDKNMIPKNVNEFDLALLEKIKNFKNKEFSSVERTNFHGKLVVERLTDYRKFVFEWRDYFRETMKPKSVPESWDAELNLYKNSLDQQDCVN